MSVDVLLHGGWVVDGTGTPPFRADVVIDGGRIRDVGYFPAGEAVEAAESVDCSGRYLLPGLIDAHSHADSAVLQADAALALLRQGVTTVVAGQDGVSFAPGDGGYGTEYFGALNGVLPSYSGGGVAALLAGYAGATPVNVAYLVPHGTVRHEVMGYDEREATADELARMVALVQQGLDEGAVGLSTGLDYVPGRFAGVPEFVALCRPVAAAGGLYVSHTRGYETRASIGVGEVREIARGSGVISHISHYHGPAESLAGLIDESRAGGVDVTFDAYPYRAGFTLLAMPILPATMMRSGLAAAAAQLADEKVRAELVRDYVPTIENQPSLGPGWPERVRIAHVGAAEYAWVEGLTLAEAAARAEVSPGELAYRMMAAARLAVSAVMTLPGRSVEELRALLRHEAHMGGSDGIFVGTHPHPRAYGTFARYLGRHTRELGDYTWGGIAAHLAGHPARRYGLRRRGLVVPDYAADVIVVDPATVADRATYDEPRLPAVGIDDVLVNGEIVLRDGKLSGTNSGVGLRRG
ncbi:MAG TPA: amidohydrolase family protein [Mycobacteriales bacterium]|jgi:N-acyl-D-amino-acid deacylase|nr:amidohydrolase family protein [Mycobacteriales bacterium]